MSAYLRAIEELNTVGFISDYTLSQLTPEDAARAIQEAGYKTP